MFGKVPLLKYVDYNIMDPNLFLELQFDKYTKVIQKEDGTKKLVTQEWVKPLWKSGILTLLKFPHFSRSPIVQACVSFLLTKMHGRYLWLDQSYPIFQNTMHWILGLPTSCEDPTDTLKEKHTTHKKCVSFWSYDNKPRYII